MESIHVPADVVKKHVSRAALWLLTAIGGALVAAGGFAWDWLKERVEEKFTDIQTAAKVAQADSHHAKGLVDEHALELVEVWREIVLLHAELQVQREYSRSPDRGAYIEKAKKFYDHAYTEERDTRPNALPSKSAERVLGLTWRPDR